MIKNNKKAIILSTFILINIIGLNFSNISYASTNSQVKAEKKDDVGNIHIKNEPTEKTTHSSVGKGYFDLKKLSEVGNIKIASEPNLQIKPKKITTQEAMAINKELNSIVSLQNSKNFSEAKERMTKLVEMYPENGVFYKWTAIYQNMLRDYNNSSSTIEQLRMMFPLSSGTVEKDFMLRYYEIDNTRNTNTKAITQQMIAELLKDNAKRNSNKYISDIKEKDLTKILCQYQTFLLNNPDYKDVDKEELSSLWKKIPKNKQKTLDDFYGYNLDDLTYIYGMAFNRKDLLKEYVEHEKENKDTIIRQQIKNAKKVLFRKY